MSVEKFMTKRIVTVEMDDTLDVVKDIFEHTQFHHLLVVEEGELAGVISDRDFLKAISANIGKLWETPKDKATLNKRVHQIMSRDPFTLEPNDSIDKALDYFVTKDISSIPVVNDENEIVGILSWRDILRAMKAYKDKHFTKQD